jgi:hypothetical protein
MLVNDKWEAGVNTADKILTLFFFQLFRLHHVYVQVPFRGWKKIIAILPITAIQCL